MRESQVLSLIFIKLKLIQSASLRRYCL